MGYLPTFLVNELLEAALEQPNPTDRLKNALAQLELLRSGAAYTKSKIRRRDLVESLSSIQAEDEDA